MIVEVSLKIKILVIGERSLKDTVAQALQESECEIFWQHSSEKAQESATAHSPDLIIADFGMPHFSPFKFLGECMDEQRQVVMVAAAPAIEDVVKCMQLGARDFLQYPKEHQKLLELLKNAYAQWRKTQHGLSFQAE